MELNFDEFKLKYPDLTKWHTFWLKDSNITKARDWCTANCIGTFCIKTNNRRPPQNHTLLVSERKDRIAINKEFGRLW